jgi:hypothetical protein
MKIAKDKGTKKSSMSETVVRNVGPEKGEMHPSRDDQRPKLSVSKAK